MNTGDFRTARPVDNNVININGINGMTRERSSNRTAMTLSKEPTPEVEYRFGQDDVFPAPVHSKTPTGMTAATTAQDLQPPMA